MEVIRNLLRSLYPDVPRKHAVQRGRKPVDRNGPPCAEADHLPRRMHAGIRPTRPDHSRRLPEELPESSFEFSLDRARFRLLLKTPKIGTIVVYDSLEIAHGGSG